MTAATIAASSWLSAMPVMNERSIFTVSTGSCSSSRSEDCVVPKSSIARRQPSSLIPRSTRPARTWLAITAASVNSRQSVAGSAPELSSASLDDVDRVVVQAPGAG